MAATPTNGDDNADGTGDESVYRVEDIIDSDVPTRLVLPRVELTDTELRRVHELAAQRNDSYDLNDGGTIYGDNGSEELHVDGLIGEAAVCKYYDGSLDGLDEFVGHGDDGHDITFHRDIPIRTDVKVTKWGYERDCIPYLKVKEKTLAEKRDAVDLYILTEKIDERSVRIIGFTTPAELIENGLRVGPGADIANHPEFDAARYGDYRVSFTSHSHNVVATPDMLWLAKPTWR